MATARPSYSRAAFIQLHHLTRDVEPWLKRTAYRELGKLMGARTWQEQRTPKETAERAIELAREPERIEGEPDLVLGITHPD